MMYAKVCMMLSFYVILKDLLFKLNTHNDELQVLCVLYPLLLGYDVLFQDVDIVWLTPDRDPLAFFQDESSKLSHFDVIFQHDGSNNVRYAPYSANSGFYYARANKKTQYLFTSLLYHSDLILTWDSHQQVLVQLLSEHSSLFGLNVKVLGRDTEMFPGESPTPHAPELNCSNLT
jgi:hypothetical protein